MKKTTRTIARQTSTNPADYDPMPGTAKSVDISGQRFGTFTAIKLLGSRKGNTYWLARCDCGAERPTALQSMRNGDENRSPPQCDECRKKKRIATYISLMWANRVHADCEGWASREEFATAVGRFRRPGTYLHKVNHTAPWGPGNFRWADKKPGPPPTFFIGGKTMKEIAAEWGVTRQRVFQSLHEFDPDTFEGDVRCFGWPVRDVVRACREIGVSHSAMCDRLRAGLSLDEAVLTFAPPADKPEQVKKLKIAEQNGAMDFPAGEVIVVRASDPEALCTCLRAAAELRGQKVHTRQIDGVVMFRFKENE